MIGPSQAMETSRPLVDKQQVEQALMGRPSLSIRTRILGGFAILFMLMCGGTVVVLILISQLRTKTLFLDKIEEYAFEVQQARRFEKNFFLYGANLRDALRTSRPPTIT